MELNLTVGKINFVLPNFTLSTFNTSIKHSKCLHFNIEAFFQTAQILLHVHLQIFKVNQFNKGAS